MVNREELHFGRDRVQDSFKTLVDRKIRSNSTKSEARASRNFVIINSNVG